MSTSAEAKRSLAAALTELEAAVAAKIGAQDAEIAAKLAEAEAELAALRKARAEDAEMIEAALSELREAV